MVTTHKTLYIAVPINVPVFDGCIPARADDHPSWWTELTVESQLNRLYSVLVSFELLDLAPV